MRRILFVLLTSITAMVCVMAQPRQQYIRITVTPDHSDWTYKCGEKPKFDVQITTCSNAPVENVKIHYEIAEDCMPPIESGDVTLGSGKKIFSGHTMKKPGFMRCAIWAEIDGFKYNEYATAGFDIDKIEPKSVMPTDFDQFWGKAIEESRRIPMLPELTLVPEKCTSSVNVYSASFQNFRKGSRIFGTLCVPKDVEGKRCPAILIVPGAGCRARKGFYEEAEKGFVTFEVGIHGIPTTMPNDDLYLQFKNGSLLDYPTFGADDADRYYYKRVFVGCARAIDFLAELPFVDPDRIGVTGGSQGGALTITTAALNPKVKCAAAIYPAMCDLTGVIYGQGDSWPHLFTRKENRTPERLRTAQYYDVANFARKLTIPVFFTYGFNDDIVCPSSTTAAYNIVPSSDKSRLLVPQSRHYTYPEQWKARSKWMMEHLSK